jgi:hypothetical protein
MMKRFAAAQVVVGLVLLLGHGNAIAGNGVGSLAKNKAYSVQIIAHDTCPAGSFDDTSRRSIAVLAGFTDSIKDGTLLTDIDKTNKIFLAPGTDFWVTDGNACDGDGAGMMLPSDVTTYEVYVRLVGQPNSKIDVSTCLVDTTGQLTTTVNAVLCSTDHFVKTRYTGKGEPSFTNATSQLLYISNPTLCGSGGKCGLFDAGYLNYFWDWNTPLGRPHAQLWFVPVQ